MGTESERRDLNLVAAPAYWFDHTLNTLTAIMKRILARLLVVILTIFSQAGRIESQQPALPAIAPGLTRLSQTLGGLDSPGTAITFDERSGILAAATESGTIHYWNKGVTAGLLSGDRTPHVLQAHSGAVTGMAWSGSLNLISAGTDQKIQVTELPGERVASSIATSSVARVLAVSPDGKLLATAGEDRIIQLWNLETGKAGAKLTAHTDWITSLAFSSDGKRLASGGYDGMVRVWDTAAGSKLMECASQPPALPNSPAPAVNAVSALAFSIDGKSLALGGSDSQVYIVTLADGKIIRTLQGHGSSVTALAFHPSDTLLVSSGKDRTVRLWTPSNGQPIKVLEGHTAWVQGICFMAQGTRLASVGADQTVRLWDLK